MSAEQPVYGRYDNTFRTAKFFILSNLSWHSCTGSSYSRGSIGGRDDFRYQEFISASFRTIMHNNANETDGQEGVLTTWIRKVRLV